MTTLMVTSEIIRFYIGFILLASAWGKTKTYHQFIDNLITSFHIKAIFSQFLGPMIILLEWVLAIILITQLMNINLTMIICLALFSSFTVVLIYLFMKHEIVKCNCFGEAQRPITHLDLMRNLILIGAALFYVINTPNNILLADQVTILIACVALIITIMSIHFHELILLLIKGEV